MVKPLIYRMPPRERRQGKGGWLGWKDDWIARAAAARHRQTLSFLILLQRAKAVRQPVLPLRSPLSSERKLLAAARGVWIGASAQNNQPPFGY